MILHKHEDPLSTASRPYTGKEPWRWVVFTNHHGESVLVASLDFYEFVIEHSSKQGIARTKIFHPPRAFGLEYICDL